MKQKSKKYKNEDENKTESDTFFEETIDNGEEEILPKKKSKKCKTKDKSKTKSVTFSEETIDNTEEEILPKKKRKTEELEPLSTELEEEIRKPENIKNVLSKRQQKREKYEKLKAENKLKSETQMQQRALNYLSLWKHNRPEWKFEKIRQVWLQTHMFDSSRIPDEFWSTTIQYFVGSKGKIRQFLIEGCMKIVDEEEKCEDENEIDEIKFKRARELLQNLQE